MNILAIGNSFSQDATRYLHQIAAADGVPLHVANLYIGGCSLERAYAYAHETLGTDGIIPSGQLFRSLLDNGVPQVHRDTYHASPGLGRYALGLLWYRILTGNSVSENDFHHFDEHIPEEHIRIAKKCVNSL